MVWYGVGDILMYGVVWCGGHLNGRAGGPYRHTLALAGRSGDRGEQASSSILSTEKYHTGGLVVFMDNFRWAQQGDVSDGFVVHELL